MAYDATMRELLNAGVQAAAIVSRDGTVLAASLPPGVSKETFSIMCATIHGAGMTVSTEVKRSNPRRIVLESAEGRIVITEAGRRALVVMVLPADATVEHIAEKTHAIIEQIGRETG